MSAKPHDDKNPKRGKRRPLMTKKSLDRFLSSICEAAGMTGGPLKKKGGADGTAGPACQGPCAKAEWRAHLDIPGGLLCVSATWSDNKKAERHRDVTIALTYFDEKGKVQYSDMVFCDSEVRWLMETL
jgi:hypothetical protein